MIKNFNHVLLCGKVETMTRSSVVLKFSCQEWKITFTSTFCSGFHVCKKSLTCYALIYLFRCFALWHHKNHHTENQTVILQLSPQKIRYTSTKILLKYLHNASTYPPFKGLFFFFFFAADLQKMLITSFKLQEVEITWELFLLRWQKIKTIKRCLLMDFCKWCDSGKKNKRNRNRKEQGLK